MVRPRARAPTCPLATPLSFCPVSRFAPPSFTVRTSLLLSDDVCRRCNLACDRLFTLVVKFLHAPFWCPSTLAPRGICTPLPPLRYASELASGTKQKKMIANATSSAQKKVGLFQKRKFFFCNRRGGWCWLLTARVVHANNSISLICPYILLNFSPRKE